MDKKGYTISCYHETNVERLFAYVGKYQNYFKVETTFIACILNDLYNALEHLYPFLFYKLIILLFLVYYLGIQLLVMMLYLKEQTKI